MQQASRGTTQDNLSLDKLLTFEFRMPSLQVQRKIADILSAYDDLIENNTRRIAILEEMARSHYREWFVDFRFPGHEWVPIMESESGRLPENWQIVKLGDVIELAYGRALRAGDRHGGPIPVWGSSGIVGNHDSRMVEGPGIVVGRKGNVGTVYWSDDDFFVIDTAFYVRTDLPLRYVFYNLLLDQHFLSSDTAVPGLSRNQAYLNPFKIPPSEVLGAFERLVEPMLAQRHILGAQVKNLRQTRDLLLPELVSGRVSSGILREPAHEEVSYKTSRP